MTFSDEERILIKNLHVSKGYNASRLLAEFSDKGWTKRSINRLFQKLRETGTVERRVDSGRPRSAQMEENIDLVDDLIVSQEDKPQTQRTVRETAHETGIPRSSVVHIIKKDLRLKCFKRRRAHDLTDQNCAARLMCSRLLLKKFPKSAVDFIFFTDEKVFTVASPANSQSHFRYLTGAFQSHPKLSEEDTVPSHTQRSVSKIK